MNYKISRAVEVFIESLNYIILTYALTNMVLLFWHHWLFIFFFASEFWLMDRHLRKLQELMESRILSTVLWAVCFAVHIGIVYYGGRVVGEILPFSIQH